MMTLDKQTMGGAVLACVAIGLVAWLTADSWRIATIDTIVDEGTVEAQEGSPLDDPYICEDHPERCVNRP